jgi:hypothetical protein
MKVLARILTSLVMVLVVMPAIAAQVKGAEKRKRPVRFSRDAIQIDEIVRMEDDPNYIEWKKENAREDELRDRGIDEVKQQRELAEERQEKARLEFIAEREQVQKLEAKKLTEQWDGYRKHIQEKRRLALDQEQGRREFVKQRAEEDRKVEADRQARLRKVYGPDRMPAAIPDDPKYPWLKEKDVE